MKTLHRAVAESLRLSRAVYVVRGWKAQIELAHGDVLLAVVCGNEVVRW